MRGNFKHIGDDRVNGSAGGDNGIVIDFDS
jgi:hypothetical protein